MEYLIAIASTDGKVINQHFGRAKEFIIAKVYNNKEYAFLEKRLVNPPCNGGEHEEETLEEVIAVLSDCKYILCSQIGRVAEVNLRSRGMIAFDIAYFIDYAIEKIMKYDEKFNKNIYIKL